MEKGSQCLVIAIDEAEELLAEELRRRFGRVAVNRLAKTAYLVALNPSDQKGSREFLVFSNQVLPAVQHLQEVSISNWADAIFQWLLRNVPDSTDRWRLDLLTCAEKVGPRRLRLIEEAVGLRVQKYRRSLKRSRMTIDNSLRSGDLLIQLCFTSLDSAYISKYCWTNGGGRWGSCVWPQPGGVVEIPDDKAPPSRAFKKLEECLQRSPLKIERGDSVVDLGAAPGSWSYVARKLGARVIAVDRSPLRDDLMRSKIIEYVKMDAFRYRPSSPTIDWMLCDVAAFPERTLTLLEQWIENAWCRCFCVTIKFKGKPDLTVIDLLKQLIRDRCELAFMRRLTNNRNEICVWGKVANAARE